MLVDNIALQFENIDNVVSSGFKHHFHSKFSETDPKD